MPEVIRYLFFGMLLLSASIFYGCEKESKESKLPVDGDGNVYDTVVIGTQVWLAEDLKTTKYNNGVSIPLITDNNQWVSMSSPAFCWYGNNPAVKENYGALYNWWAGVHVYFLCPVGYHVPTTDEWQTLVDYLGGEEIAGDKLKAAGTQFWHAGSYPTNESGFTALPGGMRSPKDGTYSSMRDYGYWWGSTQSGKYASRLTMHYSLGNTTLTNWFKESGFSVRCIKD